MLQPTSQLGGGREEINLEGKDNYLPVSRPQ